ncbi:MAG TPA: hypothetical protein ENJ62_03630 [Bryobacterales bacterium]|nr:hypothetical protein [Bryobacterales bacterium]
MRKLDAAAPAMAMALVLLASCRGGRPEPVEIALNEESCSHCRMAVSEREFAAEAVAPDGRVDYFDDIGCLAAWVREHQPPPETALYVVDFETGEWLAAESAYYVKSDQIPTPMSFGLVAFGDVERADRAAEKFRGRRLSWQQVLDEAGR